jgi:hypothetical protein
MADVGPVPAIARCDAFLQLDDADAARLGLFSSVRGDKIPKAVSALA